MKTVSHSKPFDCNNHNIESQYNVRSMSSKGDSAATCFFHILGLTSKFQDDSEFP